MEPRVDDARLGDAADTDAGMIIFLGCSKSASKAYTHVLRTHTDIHVSSELNLFSFHPAKSVYITYLRHRWSGRGVADFAAALQKLRGTSYWRVGRFNSEDLVRELSQRWPVPFRTVFEALLRIDAAVFGKTRIGAKFPAHVVFTPVFLGWNPAVKIALLARNPMDILQSQTNKAGGGNLIQRASMVAHVATMFNITVGYAWLYRNSERVHYLPYERFKNHKAETVAGLASFLGFPFASEMTDIPVLGSKTGPDQKPIRITAFERILLNVFTAGFRGLHTRMSVSHLPA